MYVTFASPTLLQQLTPVGGGPIRTLLQPTQRTMFITVNDKCILHLLISVTCEFIIYAYFLKKLSILQFIFSLILTLITFNIVLRLWCNLTFLEILYFVGHSFSFTVLIIDSCLSLMSIFPKGSVCCSVVHLLSGSF